MEKTFLLRPRSRHRQIIEFGPLSIPVVVDNMLEHSVRAKVNFVGGEVAILLEQELAPVPHP